MDKSTIQLITDLVSEAEKIELKRKSLYKDHDQIDHKLKQVQDKKDLNDQLKKTQTINNTINKTISNKIKTNKPLNELENKLFNDWKKNVPLLTKMFTSNKTLKEQFGSFSAEEYKTNQKKIDTKHKTKDQEYSKELKSLHYVKNELKPRSEYDQPLKEIKEKLKQVDLKKLSKEVPDQNIVMKLISAVKNYIKEHTKNGLDNLKSTLQLATPTNQKKSLDKLIQRSENIIKATPRTRKPSGVKR